MNDPRLQLAIRTVAECCRVARAVQRDLEQVRQLAKDDRSPVTVADFAVQAIVSSRLRAAQGDVDIVGEEHAGQLRTDEHALVRREVLRAVRSAAPDLAEDEVLDAIDACDHDGTAGAYWALDPVDGTKGFLRGGQYAIALAWLEDGQVVHGVMGCPNLPAGLDAGAGTIPTDVTGMLYAATAGGGARAWSLDALGAEPRRISAAAGSGRHVRVCESVERAHSKQSDRQRILEHLGESSEPVHLDSQCKYALVARGDADAYLRLPTSRSYVEKIWDHAAGALIATEAGAAVSDITGARLDFGRGPRLEANRGVICAVAPLHDRIIQAIEDLGIATPV